MSKLCMKERNKKRERLTKKYAVKREEYQKALKACYKEGDVAGAMKIQAKLQKIPANARKGRLRNRCVITGRPRGVERLFGLARTKLREFFNLGWLPGVRKSSW